MDKKGLCKSVSVVLLCILVFVSLFLPGFSEAEIHRIDKIGKQMKVDTGSGGSKIFLLKPVVCKRERTAETLLVRPPFKHTMGFYSVRPRHVPIFLGPGKHLDQPRGIAAVRLDEYEKLKKGKSCELTVYGVNSGTGDIFYNKSMTSAKWVGEGSGGLWKLKDADGLAALPDGTVAVAEGGMGRIVLLRNQGGNLRFVKTVGGGAGKGLKLVHPVGVALDTERRLWVTDRDTGAVLTLSSEGEVLNRIEGLTEPTSIAVVDSSEKWLYRKKTALYVVDDNGKRISKFASSGALEAVVRGDDFGNSNVIFGGVAVDYYGNLWVVERKSSKIIKFDPNLHYIASFGSFGESGKGKFCHPWGITIWKKYGQVFITQENGAEYYWVGIDLLSCTAGPSTGGGMVFRLEFSEPPYLTLTISGERKNVVELMINKKIRERNFKVEWNGMNDKGERIPPGNYVLHVKASATYSSREHFRIKKDIPFTIPDSE